MTLMIDELFNLGSAISSLYSAKTCDKLRLLVVPKHLQSEATGIKGPPFVPSFNIFLCFFLLKY
jgi:hypothetical protein